MRTALLVGATGLVGSHVLRLLAASPHYDRVIVLLRRAIEFADPKIDVRVIDFDHIDEVAATIVVDDVFCCIGTTIAKAGSQGAFARVDRDYPIAIATLAKRNGAQQFLLVSSVGADPNSSNFYLKTKGEVEQRIANLGFRAGVFLRPSMLLGERAEFRWKEKFAEPLVRAVSALMRGSARKYHAIEAETVARAMVNVAERNSSTGSVVMDYEEIVKAGSAT